MKILRWFFSFHGRIGRRVFFFGTLICPGAILSDYLGANLRYEGRAHTNCGAFDFPALTNRDLCVLFGEPYGEKASRFGAFGILGVGRNIRSCPV
jgi:uncharacterized membrane protein YhaH (DUF805 family)